MLDTQKSIETPEGIDLKLSPASAVIRSYAYFLDLIVRGLIFIVAAIIIFGFSPLSNNMNQGVFLIFYFLFTWFYPVFFEVLNQGMTPGKKVLSIKVVHDDGTPVNLSNSIIRNFLRTVDFLPIFYFTGIICSYLNKDFKRLGDLAAGTIVVHQYQTKLKPHITNYEPIALPMPLSLSERHAITRFSERQSSFSKERQAELANLLEPLHHKKNQDAVDSLLAIANGLSKSL